MPQHHSLIAILCMGFVLAFVLGVLARRFGLSPLVGYLVAGIIAGPYTPGFVADQELAPQLAEIGVILLMFGVGMHFSWRDLMSVRAIALPGAVVQIAVATILGWAMARLLGWSHGAGIVFGLSLSVASTVVLLRALDDRRLLDTLRGRVAVGWLIVEDLAMVLALVLLPALAGLMDERQSGEGGSLLATLLLTFLKVGGFMVLMLVVGKRVIPWALGRVAAMGSRELFTLAVLAIGMGVAFGSAELFGVSFALGAFFAGMILSESEFSHQAAEETLPLRDAFAVLFFVSVGMLFNPAILVEQPLHVLATVLIIVFGKSVAAWAIVRAFGKPNGMALTISASLAQIGEFSFILAGLGLSLGMIPQEALDLVLAGALISILLNPVLFAMLDKYLGKPGSQDNPVVQTGSVIPADLAGHTLVVGYGRFGREVARELRERGVPLVVIEHESWRAEEARNTGLLVVLGNATATEVLHEARADHAALAVVAVPQALEGGEAVAHLKAMSPEITVLARAHSDEGVAHMLARGADAAVLAERELAHSLAEMVMATPPYRAMRPSEQAGIAPGIA